MIILDWQIFIKHFLNAGPIRSPKDHSSELHSNGMGGTMKALRDCWSLLSHPVPTAPQHRGYELCLLGGPQEGLWKTMEEDLPAFRGQGPTACRILKCTRT